MKSGVSKVIFIAIYILGFGLTRLYAIQDQARPPMMPTSIHGQVRFSEGQIRAEYVLVRLEPVSGGMTEETRTDRTGKFDFSNIGQAIYRVTATYPGYIPATQEVNLVTTFTEYVQLTLFPEKKVTKPVNKAGTELLLDAKVSKEARDEYDKGREELSKGSEPGKGIAHLEKAVQIDPNFLEAQVFLGTSYIDAHELDKAQKALQKALTINPKTPLALLALGEVYREKKNFQEAEKNLTEGLKLDDNSWQGHFTLGKLYWDTGNTPKAGAEIGRTLQLKPDYPDAYLIAGNIFLKANRAPEALRMFNEYLRLDPKGKFAEPTRQSVEKLKKVMAAQK
ncbi:MAG: tetratricopeptide repeat protein [Acidobacteriia bacterium]|nr:tetratricopeptide repeat protein [Terriglobia bacterium]